MTAKQYLRQIRDLEAKANNSRRYYERCIRDIAMLRSPRFDGDKVQSSASGAGFTEEIEKLVDAQANAKRLIDQYIDTRDRIIREINSLEHPYSLILFKHYVEYKDYGQISKEMAYSYNWLLFLNRQALLLFSQKYLQ